MYMLDTDICIYIIKRKPESVLNRFRSLQRGQLFMSAITFAELMNGAKKSKYIEENTVKLNALAELLDEGFNEMEELGQFDLVKVNDGDTKVKISIEVE